MVRRRDWIQVAIITAIALVVVVRAQHHVARWSCCDMTSYLDQATDFARNGLFESHHHFMSLRTYGYPLFVAWLSRLTSGSPQAIELVVCIVQFLLLIGVAWMLSALVATALKCRRVAVYGVIMLNPILLAAVPAVLTDLLSTLAATLAVMLVFHTRRGPVIGFASIFLASSAAMIRPASIVFVVMTLLLWVVSSRWLRPVRLRAWPLLLLGAVLPLVPQVINNHRLYGRNTPLIVENLYAQQQVWGMQYLKYGTLMPAEPNYYINPLYDGSSTSFFAWLHLHPGRAIGTAGLHLFSLFDQDFAFTYVHNVQPWFRWPLTALSFGFVFIAVATIAIILVRCVRRRRLGRTGLFTLAMLAACSAYVLLLLPTAVEN